LYNPRTNSKDPSHEIFVFLYAVLLSDSDVNQRHLTQILNCGWPQKLYWGYLLPLIVGLISFKTCPAVVYTG